MKIRSGFVSNSSSSSFLLRFPKEIASSEDLLEYAKQDDLTLYEERLLPNLPSYMSEVEKNEVLDYLVSCDAIHISEYDHFFCNLQEFFDMAEISMEERKSLSLYEMWERFAKGDRIYILTIDRDMEIDISKIFDTHVLNMVCD